MIEVRVYDCNLNFLGIIDNYTSLIWTRKYFEPGNFELHCPMTENNLALISAGNLVLKRDCVEGGVIEDIQYTASSSSVEAVIKGRFLSSYFDRRVVRGNQFYSGNVETAMFQFYGKCTAIPLIELGSTHGWGETTTFTANYMLLSKIESNLSKQYNIGYRVRPDTVNKKLIFELYKGIDRTVGQTVNSRVIFSEDYDNLNSTTYQYNDQTEKTLVIAHAQYTTTTSEGGNTTEDIYVELGGGSGLNLRETYIEGQVQATQDMTKEQFTEALKMSAKNSLNSNSKTESFDCTIGTNVNFIYKKDYDLGDVVTVQKKDWSIARDLRITELQEVYEHEYMTVTPTLGNPLPTSIDWSVSG